MLLILGRIFWSPLIIIAWFAGFIVPTILQAQQLQLTWEVTNRFGPFEAYRDVDGISPSEVFETWKMKTGENYQDWHQRLWSEKNGRFVSPYAGLIEARAIGRRQTALWDPVQDVHRSRIASLARGSGDVQVSAYSSLLDQDCEWQIEGRAPEIGRCREHRFSIPLEGPTVVLTVSSLEGSHSANVEIKIEHKLIVGLGESYAAGQGNPDIPAEWKAWKQVTRPSTLSVAWLNQPARYLANNKAEARWLDAECYRSFFNYQTLTALKIASTEPHSFVSFMHYACSGAEVFDGLLNPQGIPAGSNRAVDFNQGRSKSWFQARSQMNSLVMDLCDEPGELIPYPKELRDRLVARSSLRTRHAFQRHNSFVGELRPDASVSPSTQGDGRSYADHAGSTAWRSTFGDNLPTDGLPDCAAGIAKPDLVLLGIGGNDAGFESIVQFYVAPSNFKTGLFSYIASGGICPREANLGSNRAAKRACRLKKFNRYNTEALIDGLWSRKCANRQCLPLAKRLEFAIDAIVAVTGVSAKKIVTPVYPDPFRSADLPRVALDEPLPNYAGNREQGIGAVLTQGPDGGSDKVHNPLSRWIGATVLVPGGNHLAKIRRFDVTRQEAEVMIREVEAIRRQQRLAAAAGGVSLVYSTRDAFLSSPWTFGAKGHLPNSTTDGWDPATWEPYAYELEARAIRTFNDSLLTQQDLDEHIDFRGTAHPNLTGHRLLADRILPCAMALLQAQNNEICSGK